MEEAYPVLRRDYPLNEKNLEYWASDKDSPYTEVKRFDWYRGYQVGGRSLMWGRQSYRLSDIDFEANAKDGIAVDWPIALKPDLPPAAALQEPQVTDRAVLRLLPEFAGAQFSNSKTVIVSDAWTVTDRLVNLVA